MNLTSTRVNQKLFFHLKAVESEIQDISSNLSEKLRYFAI